MLEVTTSFYHAQMFSSRISILYDILHIDTYICIYTHRKSDPLELQFLVASKATS